MAREERFHLVLGDEIEQPAAGGLIDVVVMRILIGGAHKRGVVGEHEDAPTGVPGGCQVGVEPVPLFRLPG